MFCERCKTEIRSTSEAHSFSGYDFYVMFCPGCCPGAYDESDCYKCEEVRMAKRKSIETERPEMAIIMHDIAVMVSRDLQRRLFRHMVALRIKEIGTAASLAKSLVNEPGGKVTAANAQELLEVADALASTTPDAYAISDEVIDSYLKQLGEPA